VRKKERIIEAIFRQGVLPLYFHPEETTCTGVMKSLYAAGVRVIEFTNRGRQALKNFKALKKTAQKEFPDLLLGMGTVTDSKTAAECVQLGADFLVSPGFEPRLASFAKKENILWIPGCFSPTELAGAQAAGLKLVKLFPAQVLGPAFVRSVREVFPDLLFMPTGGIETTNLEVWFRSGVSAVGMGGSLISREILEEKAFSRLTLNTATVMRKIAAEKSRIQSHPL
jgi:2-dehydro-3-deoxyphosphogluconate aldolase/(4S)-4-hydroxy-2-oxoglutarate aldolase